VIAAGASTLSFALGATVPLALVGVLPDAQRSTVTFGVSLALLIALGALGARLGGARILPAALRVGFWGVVAMGVTALIGRMFGVSIT
jgi:VIT1/CCC1 family predicted Fe2+/Mn2+ transporter